MHSGKRWLALIIFIFLSASAHAEEGYKNRHLTAQASSASASRLLEEKPRFLARANGLYFPTPQDIKRVKVVKALLYGIDTKSLQETIDELEKSRHPQINLEMREAMAKTYVDIVRQINVEGQKKKEWLYSMVCLNMAYLQFGGSQGTPGSTGSLNRLIRQKLKEYLPPNALKQPGFIYSLE